MLTRGYLPPILALALTACPSGFDLDVPTRNLTSDKGGEGPVKDKAFKRQSNELKKITATGDPERPIPRSYVAKLMPGQQCPEPPPGSGWTLHSLKPRDTSIDRSDSGANLWSLLGQYCSYYRDAGEDPATLTLEVSPGTIENDSNLVADYARVVPQGFPTDEPVGHHHQQHQPLQPEPDKIDGDDLKLSKPAMGLRHQIFVQQQGATLIQEPEVEQVHPFVAIIDTADPNSQMNLNEPKREHHGLAMAGLVDALRCSEGDEVCRDRSTFSQAFPSEFSDPAHADYQALGTVWSLTEAVIDAVERWKTESKKVKGKRPPLVLNMSVGFDWDPSDTERLLNFRDALLIEDKKQTPQIPEKSGLSPSEEALFTAISWASCHGALSVAASGNTQTNSCSEQGPLAPAAWEAVPAPTRAECEATFGVDPGPPESEPDLEAKPSDGHCIGHDKPEYRGSLVYAAGGVGAGGYSIVNARPQSTPARVLYASLTPSHVGGGHTRPLTGTSVAAASLSAIAAQVWSLQPSASPRAIMQAIDGSGSQSLGYSAHLSCNSSSTTDVKRIYGFEVVPELYKSVADDEKVVIQWNRGQRPAPLSSTVLIHDGSESCGGREIIRFKQAGISSSTATNSWPELRPQPDHPMCPTCPFTANTGVLELEIELDDPNTIVGSTGALLVYEPNGSQESVTAIPIRFPENSQNPQHVSPNCTKYNVPCMVDLSDLQVSGQSISAFISRPSVRSIGLELNVITGSGTQSSSIQSVIGEIDLIR